jgi:putative PIN family toxin of toxin-antitoxin system
MKILFDTNVLISAFLNTGKCYEILYNEEGLHEFYYTEYILDEFRRKLKTKLKFSDDTIKMDIKVIKRYFLKCKSSAHITNVCRDPKDNQTLADAELNGIDIILTGDKDLLELGNYNAIKIVSPSDFWNLKD